VPHPDRPAELRYQRSGLTVRDVAELLRAHPRAIDAPTA
jgi:hypothetical protein